MLGIDTNVLVRLLIRDDEVQFAKARAIVDGEIQRGELIVVSLMVLLETEWVLRSCYGLPKNRIAAIISGLLDTSEVDFEHEPSVEEALSLCEESNADFADCLIGSHNRRLGCSATITFDKAAARLSGFRSA